MGAQSDWEPKTIDWVNAHTGRSAAAPNKDARRYRALVAGVGHARRSSASTA